MLWSCGVVRIQILSTEDFLVVVWYEQDFGNKLLLSISHFDP